MNNSSPHSRSKFLRILPALCSGLALSVGAWSPSALAAVDTRAGKSMPVILATDIGDDIDDTWALGFLLRSPELDLKLAVGEYGKPEYRAKLLAKLLERFGHGKVPVAMGMDIEPRGDGPQAEWVKDYDLKSYAGGVRRDGVQAIIETILRSKEPITVISIGPMPNLAAALEREPQIAKRARLVGMYGSVRNGYDGSKNPSPEWNVKADPKACQVAFTAPWDIMITPLDTCGLVTLQGERYQRLRDSKDPIASTIIENYRIWSKANKQGAEVADQRSSVLFDTVAVYLAFSQHLCEMETLGIRVTDDGFTRIDDQAKKLSVATEWKSLDGFRDLLISRLTGGRK